MNLIFILNFHHILLFYHIGEINVEAGLGPKFESLEKDLKGEGLASMVDKIELLRKSIAENILADMNKNRYAQINDCFVPTFFE